MEENVLKLTREIDEYNNSIKFVEESDDRNYRHS